MSDSEDSEIDVCSIDEATALNLHTGLTLVAAETYIPSTSELPVQPVPLLPEDLLTRSKQKRILQAKTRHFSKLSTKQNGNKIQTENNLLDKENHKQCINIKEKLIPMKTTILPTPVVEQQATVKKDLKTTNVFTNTLEEEECTEDDNQIDSEDELLDTGVNNMLNKFYFESDHLAIKDNQDYHSLLKTLAVLEAQRVQAIKGIEKLELLKSKALDDPLQFVQHLQEKKMPPFPKRQLVAKVPEINWLHYMTAYSGDKYVFQITTRKYTKAQEREDIADVAEDIADIDESSTDSSTFENAFKKKKIDTDNPTHNQKWAIEEQEKLEKLLIMFPPEEVEARRWEKIAKALGNRTPMQVCSRIQKFFLKLAKAKLPIPGRNPSSASMQQTKKVRASLVNYKNSSFFPSWQPNVLMNEENEDEETSMDFSTINFDAADSDEENIPDLLKDSPEYRELMELKRMKKLMLKKEKKTVKGPTVHAGFMCDGCNVDPIVGVRWHCNDCPQQQSVDFCNNCAQRSFSNETHLKHHQLIAINDNTEALLDNDYLTFEQRHKIQYNYLDPNFVPSNKSA